MIIFKGKSAIKFWGILSRELILLILIIWFYFYTSPSYGSSELFTTPIAQLSIGDIISGIFRWGILIFLLYKLFKIPNLDVDEYYEWDDLEFTLKFWMISGAILLVGLVLLIEYLFHSDWLGPSLLGICVLISLLFGGKKHKEER